jgi:carbamoyltransferase
MKILGISCFYHEAAAGLVDNGKIIAASSKERFTRQKHDASFPEEAINFCLNQAEIDAQDLDWVVFYEKPLIKFQRQLLLALEYFPNSRSFFVDAMKNLFAGKLWIKSAIAQNLKIDPEKILFVPHHLSHAAAAFYPSPFKSSAYLTLDGVGEWTTGSFGKCLGNKIMPIGELQFPNSVGFLYSAITAYLGFEVNDGELKVMGLAAYGKPSVTDKIRKLYSQSKDGSIKLNLEYFNFHLSSKDMFSSRLSKLLKDIKPADIAASLQKCTEEIIFSMLDYIYQETKEDNLVFGGGVALNSVINGQITRRSKFKNIFIFPASGDDGGAVGAALLIYHQIFGHEKRIPLENVFLGKSYTSFEIEKFLKEKNIKYKKLSVKNLINSVAKRLADGEVGGWFEGRAEYGPRALGHRSILADPRDPKMKDLVNAKIKFREEFRPFAPVVLKDLASKYFKNIDNNLSPFMLGTFDATSLAKKTVPAVVHLDGTSRIQTVNDNFLGKLPKLLKEFRLLTGVPILLNTSFNLKGEPIVNSPKDAYKTFLRSGLDFLVLENFLVEK